MVKETGKFGVDMVLAGQSFEHFSNGPDLGIGQAGAWLP